MNATKGNLNKTLTSFLVGRNTVSKSHQPFLSFFLSWLDSIYLNPQLYAVNKKKKVAASKRHCIEIPSIHLAKHDQVTD